MFLIYITIAFLNLDFIEFRSFMILESNSKEIPLKVLENLAHYLYWISSTLHSNVQNHN